MCGRFDKEMTWEQFQGLGKLPESMFPVKFNLQTRYNAAPVRVAEDSVRHSNRTASMIRARSWCRSSRWPVRAEGSLSSEVITTVISSRGTM